MLLYTHSCSLVCGSSLPVTPLVLLPLPVMVVSGCHSVLSSFLALASLMLMLLLPPVFLTNPLVSIFLDGLFSPLSCLLPPTVATWVLSLSSSSCSSPLSSWPLESSTTLSLLPRLVVLSESSLLSLLGTMLFAVFWPETLPILSSPTLAWTVASKHLS